MTRTIDTDAVIANIRMQEQSSNPATPASGYGRVFIKGDGLYFIGDDGIVSGPINKRQFVFTIQGTLVVSTGTVRIYNLFGEALTVEAAHGAVRIAPTDASILIDVNENGTTILGTRVTIPAGSNEGFSTGASISDASWAHGNYLTVDIDQIGSGTAGSDLTLTIVAK